MQRLDQTADQFIEMGDHREIATPGVVKLLGRDVEFVLPDRQVIALCPGVAVLVGDMGNLGFGNIDAFVHVPIFPSRHKGVVRLGKGHMQHERAVVGGPGVIIKFLLGGGEYLFVIVDLKVAFAMACLDHAE